MTAATAGGDFTAQQVQEFKQHFQSFDQNRDGTISVQELQVVLKNLGEYHSLEETQKIIDGVDIDKNGVISFDEFLVVMSKLQLGEAQDLSFVKVYEKQKELIQHKGKVGIHSFSQEEMTAFSEHINFVLVDDNHCTHLLPINPEGIDLCVKISDGILLCKFINKAVKDTIDMRAVNLPTAKRPLNSFEINENLEIVIQASAGIGAQVINLSASELQEGKNYPHLVLGLVWQLVKIQLLNSINLRNFPELARLLEDGETLEDLMKMTPDKLLLRWFNYHLRAAGHPRRVNNFGSDIKDSENYTALMHQIAPHMCGTDHLGTSNMEQRAQGVLANGKKLGVHAFVKPSDIAKGNSRLNLAFTAAIFNACPGLDPLEEEIEIDDIDETREEKAFRTWMNSLGIHGVHLNHLYDGLMDGMALLKVMDHIEPGIVHWKKVEMKPTNRFKKIANCNYAVLVGKQMRFSLVGIGGTDIQSCNKKLVLAIVWQLMRYHVTKLLSELQFDGKPVSDDQIMEWANNEVFQKGRDKLRMSGFRDKSLSTSLFFMNLLHAVNPNTVRWDVVNQGTNDEEKMLNARYAITTARKMGATVFLLPDDIVEVNPKLVLTFVAGIMNVACK
eukprot:1261_1